MWSMCFLFKNSQNIRINGKFKYYKQETIKNWQNIKYLVLILVQFINWTHWTPKPIIEWILPYKLIEIK